MTAATRPRPLVLAILDGWGHSERREDNALAAANLPNYRRMLAEGPWSFLATSGPAVGLPAGQMGNSEVGHMNIGGGRIVLQELDRIGAGIIDGTLVENPTLKSVIAKTKAAGGALHVLGLLSPGGVHSHQEHIAALAKAGAAAGLKVWIHPVFDGRDVPPQSALTYLKDLESLLTGVPGVNQPAGVTPAEMLRLNTSTVPTARGAQNNLGVIGGDNAGFPNGRRPGDDVVDISLRVAMGKLCKLSIGCVPTDAAAGDAPFTDGAFVDNTFFDNAFPYLRTPLPGSPN